MLKKYGLNTYGITVVELLVALAILMLVLGVGYTFLDFGQRTFAVGEKQSNLQQQARLAADIISSELRYATAVEMLSPLDTIPDSSVIDADTYYIFVNDSNALEYRSANSSRIIFNPAINSNITLSSVTFTRQSDTSLEFSVNTNQDGKQPYVISSVIFTENLALQNNSINGSQGSGIRFVKEAFTYVPAATLTSTPTTVVDGNNSYTFDLELSNASFGSLNTGDLALSGDFSGLNISVDSYDSSSATITLTGNLTKSIGYGTIKVLSSGIDGGGAAPSTNVTVLSAAASTCNLTVSKDGNGTTSPGSGIYNQGDNITFEAHPDSGWEFDKWVINGVTYEDSDTIADYTINADTTAIAYFQQTSLSLSHLTVNSITVDSPVKNMTITLTVSDTENNPTAATLSIRLLRDGTQVKTYNDESSNDGSFSFGYSYGGNNDKLPNGTYSVEVISIAAGGLSWDGQQPAYEFILTSGKDY